MSLLANIKNKIFGKAPNAVIVDEATPVQHNWDAHKLPGLVTPNQGKLITTKRDAIVAVVADPAYKRSTTASRRAAQAQLDASRTFPSLPPGAHNRAARRFAGSPYGQKCIRLERLRQLLSLNPRAVAGLS